MTVVVTGLTAERMLEMEAQTIIDAHLTGDNLILVQRDLTEIDIGSVRGIQGLVGPSGSGYAICTSGTRPGSPPEGLAIYETDTKLVRVWNGTRWRCQEVVLCTSATRPASLVAADEGVKIYETDTNREYIWSGSAWTIVPLGTIICTSGTRPASPYVGQKIHETDTGYDLVYQGATTGWTPEWATAWGQVNQAVTTTDQNNFAGPVNLSGLTASWTAIATRRYKTSLWLPRVTQNTSQGLAAVQIYDNAGATTIRQSAKTLVAGASSDFSVNSSETGLTGAVTRRGRASTTAGTMSCVNSTAGGAQIIVEDTGPTGPPP